MLTAEDAQHQAAEPPRNSVRRRMQTGLDHMIDVTSLIPHPHLAV
jgi:hypothetical protein